MLRFPGDTAIAGVNIAMCALDSWVVHHVGLFLLVAPIILGVYFLLRRQYKAAVHCGLVWGAFFMFNYIYKFHILQCEP